MALKGQHKRSKTNLVSSMGKKLKKMAFLFNYRQLSEVGVEWMKVGGRFLFFTNLNKPKKKLPYIKL